MISPNVNAPNFIGLVPVDPLNQRVFTYLNIGATVLSDSATYNVVWARPLADPMAMAQALGGTWWLKPLPAHVLGITDVVASTVDRPGTASHTLGITDSFVYAGTVFPPFGGSNTETEATFDSDAKKGMVVYVPSSAHADLAQADAWATTYAVGLVVADVASGSLGSYVTEGPITRADWTDVTGTATLWPGAYYYLSSASAGKLSFLSPTTTGQFVVAVGRALSDNTLDIEIAQPILL